MEEIKKQYNSRFVETIPLSQYGTSTGPNHDRIIKRSIHADELYSWFESKLKQREEEVRLDAQVAYDKTYKFVDEKHGGRQAMALYSEFKRELESLKENT